METKAHHTWPQPAARIQLRSTQHTVSIQQALVSHSSIVDHIVRAESSDCTDINKATHNVTPTRVRVTIFVVDKQTNTTYSECVSVALVIQHAMRMRRITSWVPCPALLYRVIQEESAILWEMTVCVILSKKVHTNMGPILNGYRDMVKRRYGPSCEHEQQLRNK